MVSSYALKIIAMVLMVLDHIYTFLPDIPIWFGYLGKCSAPIFFYLLVEGVRYTRDRKAYLFRLFGSGIFMIGMDYLLGIHNNIFLSLGFGAGIMCAVDYGKRSGRYIPACALAVLCSIAMIFTEASLYGLAMTFIFYFLWDHKVWLSILYAAFSLEPVLMLAGIPEYVDQIFLFDYQWMMVFALPLFLLYNGKKGRSTKLSKWIFYVFYPLHLTVIVLIARFATH